jgi:hypothetical protein
MRSATDCTYQWPTREFTVTCLQFDACCDASSDDVAFGYTGPVADSRASDPSAKHADGHP